MTRNALIGMTAAITIAMMSHGAFAQVLTHVPGTPNNPRWPSHTQEHCADKMGHMRRVSAADIQAIHPGQRVGLIPVCEDLTVPGKNHYGALFVNGNVNRLRVPLGRNGTLMQALVAKGYDQHDVVSLRFGANDSIILYVHQRDMN